MKLDVNICQLFLMKAQYITILLLFITLFYMYQKKLSVI